VGFVVNKVPLRDFFLREISAVFDIKTFILEQAKKAQKGEMR
jgi:hypothetical protein